MTLDQIRDHRSRLPKILKTFSSDILHDWFRSQSAPGFRRDLLDDTQLRQESQEFLDHLVAATQEGSLTNIFSPEWQQMRDFLAQLGQSRGEKGFSPLETVSFVFSLKYPLYSRLQQELPQDEEKLVLEIGLVTNLLDQLGMWTTEAYLKAREVALLEEQQALLVEAIPQLTPWTGVLVLPLTRTLDPARWETIFQTLLPQLNSVQTVILDLREVTTLELAALQALLQAVTVFRLLGVELSICGLQPTVAQTLAESSPEWQNLQPGDFRPYSTLAVALEAALQHSGYRVVATHPRYGRG